MSLIHTGSGFVPVVVALKVAKSLFAAFIRVGLRLQYRVLL